MSTHHATATPSPLTGGLLLRDLRDLPSGGWSRLRARTPAALAIGALWAAGIVVDAISTLLMGAAGFEEANPVAAVLLDQLGPVPGVALASVWAAVLALSACAWPRTLPGRAAVVTLVALGAVKAAVAAANVILAATGVDVMPLI